MRRRVTRPPTAVSKINVTPLIDVVMCLIIFYLLVGRLSTAHQVKDLPRVSEGSTGQSQDVAIVEIRGAGAPGSEPIVALDGAIVSMRDLQAALSNRAAQSALPNPGQGPVPGTPAAPNLEVELRASRLLPYADLAPVLKACRQAGLTSVKLVAERPS